MEVFTLLKPEGEAGKSDRKEAAKGNAECAFQNCCLGTQSTWLVDVTFPERAWHLMNHFNNVLMARSLAGELPAIEYDEAFRQRASHNELAQ